MSAQDELRAQDEPLTEDELLTEEELRAKDKLRAEEELLALVDKVHYDMTNLLDRLKKFPPGSTREDTNALTDIRAVFREHYAAASPLDNFEKELGKALKRVSTETAGRQATGSSSGADVDLMLEREKKALMVLLRRALSSSNNNTGREANTASKGSGEGSSAGEGAVDDAVGDGKQT